ncbi:dTDP-4-amino-4,6-dideoxygalactose transaminase [Salibacterium halotolerans]|uniref:dTDP-4-amino-4,6-dideoxygalactose transaminase n=1 Tax=Salibacterium halotolerans TaxID=1884432 RepID=A0A1I5WQI6_9BACI|nr:dTDP-4-amino-4,6-dideoxygalactose transaminase [Salibacterium halotolerans]SFQ22033.1 dTDP-4-amino-4,6-dideoxygalactose transaminase [Salibacterium halotolerans]
MIPFNTPPVTGDEMYYMQQALENGKLSGDGPFTKACQTWLEDSFHASKAFLTPSCTHALEMAAMLAGIEPGDEVIMPSYTFVSTANAFVLRGARIVFVDIRPDTMNIDETKIEEAVTEKTRVIVPVHYAGTACEMDTIMDISKRHNLQVIEDAAQGVMSTYKGQALGTIGDYGCFSFHDTKNYTSGEGGALLLNRSDKQEQAEIIREKGTDRSRFLRGQVDKYSWVEAGSSYLPAELNAAYLYAQLQHARAINNDRLASWETYAANLRPLEEDGLLELPKVPAACKHNAHMFYIKTAGIGERTALVEHLKQAGITSAFHYVPLHSSAAGQRFGRFHGTDRWTTGESERLLRLPMFYGLQQEQIKEITEQVRSFYK